MLQQRATLIDELRRGQSAAGAHDRPDQPRASRDDLAHARCGRKGFDVTIQGRCLSLTSLSDFVGNLEASRYFKRPVEILSSEVVPGEQGAPDTIRFTHSRFVPDGRHRPDRRPARAHQRPGAARPRQGRAPWLAWV